MYFFSPAEICCVRIGRVPEEFKESLKILHGRSLQHLISSQTLGVRVGFTFCLVCV